MQAKNIYTYHEAEPQLFGLSALAYDLADNLFCNDQIMQSLKQGFLTARGDLLELSLYCGKGYVETGPHATFLAPIILSIFPQAKFIHLVRSPKDVVRSGMRRKWYSGHHYDPVRIIPKENAPFRQVWQEMDSLDRNIWLWAETNRWIKNFMQTLPKDQQISLRSEDVFAGNEKSIQDLFQFIGSEMPNKNKLNRILNRKLNAQHKGNFRVSADWLENTPDDLNQFLSEISSNLGYEIE
jgi:hypothetical protein